MTKGRDNAAENLGDILELVRLRRQNGTLSVERFQAGRFEEGEIYIQGGQPTHARTGQMSGQEALTWMLSWSQVYFTFHTEEPLTTAAISSAVSTKANDAATVSTNTQNTSMPTRFSQANASATLPNTPSRFPQVNAGMREAARSAGDTSDTDNTYQVPDLNPSFGTPGLEWLVPQKLGERDVLSLPLTRPQRSIYLLINGNRSISDLSRCTRKSVQEIERLLTELREKGLISV